MPPNRGSASLRPPVHGLPRYPAPIASRHHASRHDIFNNIPKSLGGTAARSNYSQGVGARHTFASMNLSGSRDRRSYQGSDNDHTSESRHKTRAAEQLTQALAEASKGATKNQMPEVL